LKKWHLAILRSLLSEPTAPFAEGAIAARVRHWAARLGLDVSRDAAGNLLLRPREAKRTAATWLFAAHMDHPGFIARSQRGRVIEADFIGGRPERVLPQRPGRVPSWHGRPGHVYHGRLARGFRVPRLPFSAAVG
jgi:putative aminopeptidase FrvX